MNEFVYIVLEREFMKCNESVYKIGRTKDIKARLYGYPKGTKLLQLSTVLNSQSVEKQIMKAFKQKFKQRTDIGTEYFEGIYAEMLCVFNEIVKSAQPSQAPIPERHTVSSHVSADVMSMMLKQQENTQIQIGLIQQQHCMIMKHQETTLQQNSDLIQQNTALVKMHKMHTCDCGYTSSTTFNLKRHQQSKAHALNMSCPAIADDNGNYSCKTCSFETDHKGHYRTHMLSNRHAAMTEVSMPTISPSDPVCMLLKQQEQLLGMMMKHQETTQQQTMELVNVVLTNR